MLGQNQATQSWQPVLSLPPVGGAERTIGMGLLTGERGGALLPARTVVSLTM